MSKNKSLFSRVGRYLVEIMIIIIGITLSFAVNEWKEGNANKTDYYEHLVSLQQDLQIDSLQIANDYQSYRNINQGTYTILRSDEKYRKDSLLEFALAVDALSNYVNFLPNNNTFQMLRSTGGFRVFGNKELVKEITQLYQFDFAFIDMMGEEVQTERRNNLEPYLLKSIVMEDKETFPQIKTDISALANDPLFRNLCYTYRGSTWSLMNAHRRAMKQLRKVSKILEEELETFE